jgi:hypothetical protein
VKFRFSIRDQQIARNKHHFSPSPPIVIDKTMYRFDHFCKAAVSLNNNAVALLSRGFVREAMDTIKDAIKLLNIASEARCKTRDCEYPGFSVERLQNEENIRLVALQRAQQRMATATAKDANHCQFVAHVYPLSNQIAPFALLQNDKFFQHGSMPIIIDQQPNEEDEDDAFDLECAIVLYNYGVSHSLLADWAIAVNYIPMVCQVQCLRVSALCFFELSHSLFTQLVKETLQLPAMLLGMLLTRSLIPNCLELGRSPDKYRKEQERLLVLVRHQHRLFPAATELRAAPAA